MAARYSLRFTPLARRQLEAARLWWRVHRRAAPGAIDQALRAARTLLSNHPEAGPLDEEEAQQIHRLFLVTVPYCLFYRVDHKARRIDALAFWHTSRLEPNLSG